MLWVRKNLKVNLVPTCHGQQHIPLDQAAQSPIQPTLLLIPICSIVSLVYFGIILTDLEAKGELMVFLVFCNHTNLETTSDNMIVSLSRSRCIKD